MRYAGSGARATHRVRTRDGTSRRRSRGVLFGNGTCVLPSRAPPLSLEEKVSAHWQFWGLGGAVDSRPGPRTQNGISPHPRPGRRGAQAGQEGGAASGGFQVQVSWEPQPPEGSPTSHAQNALEELLRFRFFSTVLRSPASIYILPRGARSRGRTREFTAHNSSAARSQRFAALRGGSHPAAMFTTREPPQNHPPSPHPSLPAPPRQRRCKAAFNSPPHPLAARAARRLRGVRLRGSGGEGGGAAGLKRPEPRGAGEGLGPGPSLLFSSQRVPARAPARLSHVRAKTPLQSPLPARGQPPPGRPSDPRTPARAAGQAPGLTTPPPRVQALRRDREGRARGRPRRSPGGREQPSGVRVPFLPTPTRRK